MKIVFGGCGGVVMKNFMSVILKWDVGRVLDVNKL